MSKRVFLVASIFLLNACQSGSGPGNLATPPPVPSSTPIGLPTPVSSPAPTAVPIEGQNQLPAFSMTGSTFCPGQATTVSLDRSNLNRGNIAILLQVRPDLSQIPASEIKPMPDIPTDPVLLGQLAVSPLGSGQLQFTLQPDYVTRSGVRVSLKAGDAVTLYAEKAPSSYVRINDVKVCPPSESPGPDSRPTPSPSIPASPTPDDF